MATLIEQTRGYHEDMEKIERLIVRDFQQEMKSHRERLYQGHRVSNMIDKISDRATKLVRACRIHSFCRTNTRVLPYVNPENFGRNW
jgi:hypothetical protein